MGKEIERKFLIRNTEWQSQATGILYHQGYLNTHKERVVRIRIAGKKAFLTIKGITEGVSRLEYEYEIDIKDAEEMLEQLCEQPTLIKHRYTVEYHGFTWEIDVFHGENEGLMVAEIELESEEEHFEKPDWIGREVTYDTRYFNANLISNPFKNWK